MVPTQPPLGPGRHLLTHRVASFMEAASKQAGQRWSDSPSCTDELIATLARGVNNALSSETRPRLAALVPLVIGLHADDPRWHSWVVMHVASTTVPVAPESQQRSLAVAILSAARSLRPQPAPQDPTTTRSSSAADTSTCSTRHPPRTVARSCSCRFSRSE